MTLGLIWAQSPTGVIGMDGTIPWRVQEDSAHFRTVTGVADLVMGRRTWDSLPDRFRPLPGRRNIVVTRQQGWHADGAIVANSVEAALAVAGRDMWIIGGSGLYTATIDKADVLEVSEIDVSEINTEPTGDTFAPRIDDAWAPTRRDPADGSWRTSRTGIRYRFVTYERISRDTGT